MTCIRHLGSHVLAFLLIRIGDPVATKFVVDIIFVASSNALSKHFVFIGQRELPIGENSTWSST